MIFMKNNKLSIILLVLAATLIFTGCGAGKNATSEDSAESIGESTVISEPDASVASGEAGDVITGEQAEVSYLLKKSTRYDSEGKIINYTVFEYDQAGREKENTLYNAEHTVLERHVTEYDETGKEISSLTYDDAGNVMSGYVIETGENGIEKKLVYLGGKLKGWSDSKYDEEAKTIWQKNYNSKGELVLENKIEGDKSITIRYTNGEIESTSTWKEVIVDEEQNKKTTLSYENGEVVGTSESWYDADGHVIKSKNGSTMNEYSYDENGNRIFFQEVVYNVWENQYYYQREEYEYNANNVMVIRNTFVQNHDGDFYLGSRIKYDSEGRKIEEEEFRQDGTRLWLQEITYDEYGNEIKDIQTDSDGVISRLIERVYDENGNLLKQYYKEGDFEAVKEQEYDDHGNLIKYICHENGKITVWEEREYQAVEITKE